MKMSMILLAALVTAPAFAGPKRVETGRADVRNAHGEMRLVTGEGGVRVERLRAAHPGAPLAAGDVIARVDGAQVRTPEHLLGRLRDNPSAKTVRLSVLRDGRAVDVNAETAWFAPFMTPAPPTPPAAPGL